MDSEQQISQNSVREFRTNRSILQEILYQEAIKTDNQLRQAQLIHSQAYFLHQPNISNDDILTIIDTQERRMRMYLMRQVADFLYTQSPPARLLECGSAGDISAALALPTTQIVSVDLDKDIFLNVPYNLLPKEYLESIGKKRSREYYGGWDLFGKKRKKLALIKEVVPNLNIQIHDATHLPYYDNDFNGAFIQGTPDMFNFLPEMARVVRHNGFIWGIIHEQVKPKDAPSVYETGQYNQDTYSDCIFTPIERLDKLDLERVPTPDKLRQYENLCEWRDEKGDLMESGFIIEIFKKKGNTSRSAV